MYFAVLIRYRAAEADLQAHNAEHREYLRPFFEQRKLVVAGPFVPRTGGLLLFNVESTGEIERILAGDPFHKLGFYEKEVFEWSPTLGREDFDHFAAS